MKCPQSPSPYELFVGADIAAATATVAWQFPQKNLSKPLTIEQTPEGFALLQRAVLAMGMAPAQTLVVMQATGTYWLSLATFLVQQGFAVSVINPAQAHHFAKALLKRAKTDAIDAQTLAQLALLLQPARLYASAADLRRTRAAAGPARRALADAWATAQPTACARSGASRGSSSP